VSTAGRSPPFPGAPEGFRHVVFRLGEERYGLALTAVREVVVTPDVFTRVPRAPPAVSGVCNLRGRVVTVVDLQKLLGLTAGQEAATKLLVLDRGRRDLALGVSDVEGIEGLEVPSTPATGLVRGVARLGAVKVQVLDVEELDARVTGLFRGR